MSGIVGVGDDAQVSREPVAEAERLGDPRTYEHGGPNDHFAFGHGPHFCLGAQLARVQMQTLFRDVLARTSWLAAEEAPVLLRSTFQRGVKSLPMRWQP